MDALSIILVRVWIKDTEQSLEGSVFFPFLHLGFTVLNAFKKIPWEIGRMQSSNIHFSTTSAPSFENLILYLHRCL